MPSPRASRRWIPTISIFTGKQLLSANTLFRFVLPIAGKTALPRMPDVKHWTSICISAFVLGRARRFGLIQKSIKVSGLAVHLASPGFPAQKPTRSAQLIHTHGYREHSCDKQSTLAAIPRRSMRGSINLLELRQPTEL